MFLAVFYVRFRPRKAPSNEKQAEGLNKRKQNKKTIPQADDTRRRHTQKTRAEHARGEHRGLTLNNCKIKTYVTSWTNTHSEEQVC